MPKDRLLKAVNIQGNEALGDTEQQSEHPRYELENTEDTPVERGANFDLFAVLRLLC